MSIAVRNISKSFGSFKALDDVSLDMPTGELIALLGPSGCGKTTLLRIIAGLETADRGSIVLEGRDASATHVRDRQVGFVFQHYALFRHMSVFENVAFGLRVKPRRERPTEAQIRSRVLELLDLVKLAWLADRYPSQLSGGQRQRIALARALAVEPRVLLLDEPFGALDAAVRKELRRWLRSLHDRLRITSIFVTHDQEEALEVADRIVLMNRGKVDQVGSPAELYERPASDFAFGFLGTTNKIPGKVSGGRIDIGGGSIDGGPQWQDGASVVVHVRPHDLAVARAAEAPSDIPARVQRVLALGATGRVELQLDGVAGEAVTLEAEMPRHAVSELQLAPGERVFLSSRSFRTTAAP